MPSMDGQVEIFFQIMADSAVEIFLLYLLIIAQFCYAPLIVVVVMWNITEVCLSSITFSLVVHSLMMK